MENSKKTFIRSTKPQIRYLNNYMACHQEFAAGDYKTPLGAAQNNAQWERLKAALDELGPARSVEQWKLCWRDQKKKARVESAALQRAQKSTGNREQLPGLSENAELVLSAIGPEMALGFGPAESPIGLTPAASTTPVPQPLGCGTGAGQEAPSTSAEPAPAPPATGHRPAKRVRRVLPPERFISAQRELNNVVKDLARGMDELRQGFDVFRREVVEELRINNRLKEAHLQFLQQNKNEGK